MSEENLQRSHSLDTEYDLDNSLNKEKVNIDHMPSK